MNLQAPQIIFIVLTSISFVLNALLDGHPRTGKYSFGTWFAETLITLGLLYWGGFFTV